MDNSEGYESRTGINLCPLAGRTLICSQKEWMDLKDQEDPSWD